MTELPKGWELKKLGEVARFINGRAYKRHEMLDKGVPILRIQNLNGGNNWFYSDLELHEDKYCQTGDLLYAWSATFGPYWARWENAIYHYHIWKVEPKAGYLKSFAYYQLMNITEDLKASSRGVAMPHITKSGMEKWEVAVPPFEEQKRIADKLDSVLAKVEAAQARLDKIPAILKRFRQSVLAAATSGELTKEWRKTHRERSNSLSNFFIEEYDGSRLTELPANWGYVEFKNAAIIKSNLVDPKLSPKSIHLAPNHIEPNTGRVLEQVTVEEDGVKSSKHRFFEGQLIYSKIRPYLNKVCLVSFSGLCSADMYPIEPEIDEKYLLYVMLSEQFVFFASQQQGRVVLPKINQKALNKIPIPVPPEREQTEISRKVEELLSKAEIVERQYWAAKRSISHLNQSILSKAFKGELLTKPVESEVTEIENSVEALNA